MCIILFRFKVLSNSNFSNDTRYLFLKHESRNCVCAACGRKRIVGSLMGEPCHAYVDQKINKNKMINQFIDAYMPRCITCIAIKQMMDSFVIFAPASFQFFDFKMCGQFFDQSFKIKVSIENVRYESLLFKLDFDDSCR